MQVPFFDWPGLFNERRDEFLKIIHETLGEGRFILQKDVREFEQKVSQVTGVKHAIGVSDGTNAILLGLRASNMPLGSEVLLSSHSFIAAAQSIHHAGYIPVPVDISENDWLMCPQSVEASIGETTAAIMAVHVNGRMCNMTKLSRLANKHDLLLFEDAAQALGAKHAGVGAGGFGEWGTFSFYPSKTLGSFGDAGAVVTSNSEIASKIFAMRNHGADEEKLIPLDVDIWGTNCRLDNLQAALLSYKISYYDEAIARRRKIAQAYHDTLVEFSDCVDLPPPPDANGKNYDVFQNYEFCCDNRDSLRRHLSQKGIGTIIQWGGFGINQLTGLGMGRALPISDKFFTRSLLIPLNHIMSDNAVEYVCKNLKDFFEHNHD